MKTFTLIILLSVLQANAQSQPGTIRRLDNSRITTVEIDSLVNKLMDAARVQGLSLAILNGNAVVYRKAYGFKNKKEGTYLDTTTLLQGASFTKSVFAYLCMVLVQEKILDLDKPLYKYLARPLPAYPYYASLEGDDRWKLITPRMCLSHTTGLPNIKELNVHTGEVDTTLRLKIYFQPGHQYAYSGEGLRLLQLVVEEITQKNIDELAIEKVFKPIGMNRTGFIWHADFDDNLAIGHLENDDLNPKSTKTVPRASGNMVTTITDFSNFVQYIMQGKGLSRTNRAMMLTPQIFIKSKYQFPTIMDETTNDNKKIGLAYGLGWGLLKTPAGRAFYKEGHDDAWRNYTINFYDRGIGINYDKQREWRIHFQRTSC